MDLISVELQSPASQLYAHNLMSIINTAVSASNAQYHKPEFLNRLNVKLWKPTAGDNGWDVFSLNYHVDQPINTIFDDKTMHDYLRIFNFL
jgi:gamma-tubulin complex component 3